MNHSTPPEPPPHQLADWLHQQFLSRTAPTGHASLWPEPYLVNAALTPIELDFSRKDVQSGRVGPAIDHLMELSDSPQGCAQNASRLRLTFNGYQHNPHEIAQIREIAHYFQAITAHWPYWMHFMSPQADNIATLLNLTFTPQSLNVQGERVFSCIEICEPSLATFQKMAHATLNLHNTMGAPLHVTHTMGSQLRHALCLLLA